MTLCKDAAQTVVCTIVSKNYLAFARTLMKSLATVHPQWKQFVLLVDDINGCFDPAAENFQIVPIADLLLPDAKKFLFRYDILELNTAVKPWFLQWLFQRTAAERVVYLDPDIRVYSPLTAVEQLLGDGALMTLTPHLLAELNDDRRPSDRDILQAGCYNLGFLALSRHRELPRFLTWWQNKLTYDCRVDLSQGLFVDQRWMDLAPGLFSDVAILRHPGYNVAYWNLQHRPVRLDKDGPRVAEDPLVFFHFSGLDPLTPAAFSKHQDRYRLKDLGACGTLVKSYCQEVIDNGWQTCKRWPYAFGALADGTPIPASMRRYYRSHPDIIRRVGSDPFHYGHDYLNQSCDGGRQPLVTRLMHFIWESRQDLQDAFPDIQSAWREEFVKHFVEYVAGKEGIPEAFVQPVRESLNSWTRSSVRHYASPDFVAVDHPAAWLIRALAHVVLTVAPVPRSPERIRRYYRWLRPLGYFLPASVRRQLKRDMLRFVHRKLAGHPSYRLPEILRSLVRGLRRLLHFGGDTATTMPAKMIGAAFASSNGFVANASQRPQASGDELTSGAGLNIVGYLQAETGVGESARLCVQSATAVDLPISVQDITDLAGHSRDQRWTSGQAERQRHAVNLLHVNADQLVHVREMLGSSFFAGRYNIGLWHWELPKFPNRWLGAFDLVDEIWAPSRFIQDSISARSPRPVVRIPHAIRFTPSPQATRSTFGLPSDAFLFLMMYDVQSFQQRKNPEGAIEAFRKAFGGARDVTLVIKVNDAHCQGEGGKRLNELLRGAANVRVLDEKMDRQRTYDLLSVCDCVLSLHRAEGFGLVLAEAMYLGKPTIATAWSGNMEFMTPQNSCPVAYRLVRLERDIGPYERGQVWAEPDVDDAAAQMKKITFDTHWAQRIAAAGQATIRNEFSPERIGELYRQRLHDILNRQAPRTLRVFRAAA